jgi:hypothetical protein
MPKGQTGVFVFPATFGLPPKNRALLRQKCCDSQSISMTLHPSQMKTASASQRQAAASEFCASHGRHTDSALKMLLERGHRLRAREEAYKYIRDQVDALEMLTQIPLVNKDEQTLTGAAWVFIAVHIVLPFYIVSLFGHDVCCVWGFLDSLL